MVGALCKFLESPSITMMYDVEYRREEVVDNSRSRLQVRGKLLLVELSRDYDWIQLGSLLSYLIARTWVLHLLNATGFLDRTYRNISQRTNTTRLGPQG